MYSWACFPEHNASISHKKSHDFFIWDRLALYWWRLRWQVINGTKSFELRYKTSIRLLDFILTSLNHK